MSMAPPPPPTRGHRSTASAPVYSTNGNGGFKVPSLPAMSTPSRPAPSRPATPQNQAPSARGTATPSVGKRDQHERPATPSSHSQLPQPSQRPPTPNNSQQRPTTPYNQPTRDTRPTTPYGTPYGQPTRSHDPAMSVASSVSAASAAVDSPRTYARYGGTAASREEHNTLRSHASSPSVDLKAQASKLGESSRPADSPAPRTTSRLSDPESTASRFSNPTPSAPSTPSRGVHRVSRSVGCYPVSPVVEARLQNLESPSQAKLVEPTLPVS